MKIKWFLNSKCFILVHWTLFGWLCVCKIVNNILKFMLNIEYCPIFVDYFRFTVNQVNFRKNRRRLSIIQCLDNFVAHFSICIQGKWWVQRALTKNNNRSIATSVRLVIIRLDIFCSFISLICQLKRFKWNNSHSLTHTFIYCFQ